MPPLLYALIANAAKITMAIDSAPNAATAASTSVKTTWLGLSSGFWDIALIVGLAVAAVVAFAVVVITWGSIVTHKREADESQRELAEYKATVAGKVAAAELGVAKANESAAKANLLAEQEHLARLRLEASLAPRNLAEEQSRTIVAALRGKISIKVNVQSDPGDVEAYPFAQQILQALKSAEVEAEYHSWPSTFMWLNHPGVFVVTAGEVDRKQADLILKALNAAGLKVEQASTPDSMSPKPSEPGRVSVLVWKQR